MRQHLERCLRAVRGRGYEVIVVDNASTDASAELVRMAFPDIRLLELPRNLGYGSGANRGIEAAEGSYVLLLNADAWPSDDAAIPGLVACAERNPAAGVLGPSLIGEDGSPQVSRAGVPTRWWTGAPAVSGSPPGPLGRIVLSLRPRGRSFLVGAVLLLRRDAIAEVGGFDPAFFMFSEEIDLCLRMREAGWQVVLCPESTFVHVGGAATRREGARMYREQVRSHLQLLAKHHGAQVAERSRGFLARVLRVRRLLSSGDRRRLYGETATWLASAAVTELLRAQGRTPSGRTGASADRTTGSAG
jgi:N-acetylglucosaminyl-diphospho-decaprenol L-rhamnosyltransferase